MEREENVRVKKSRSDVFTTIRKRKDEKDVGGVRKGKVVKGEKTSKFSKKIDKATAALATRNQNDKHGNKIAVSGSHSKNKLSLYI